MERIGGLFCGDRICADSNSDVSFSSSLVAATESVCVRRRFEAGGGLSGPVSSRPSNRTTGSRDMLIDRFLPRLVVLGFDSRSEPAAVAFSAFFRAGFRAVVDFAFPFFGFG